jgi:predicted DNA-binding protein (MmcQ/YjbR family)
MAMRKERALSKAETLARTRLRRLAKSLGGVTETLSFGHPTFKVGDTAFAVLDRYGGEECLWVRVDPIERAQLLAIDGWRESPYDPRRTALICRLSAIDWRRISRHVRTSHRLAALGTPKRAR